MRPRLFGRGEQLALLLPYSLQVALRHASGRDVANSNGFLLVGIHSVNRYHEGSTGLREALVLAFCLSCRVVKELRAIPASTGVSPPHRSATLWPGGFRLCDNRPAPSFALPFGKGRRVGTFATSASSGHASECSVWATTPPPPTNRIAAVSFLGQGQDGEGPPAPYPGHRGRMGTTGRGAALQITHPTPRGGRHSLEASRRRLLCSPGNRSPCWWEWDKSRHSLRRDFGGGLGAGLESRFVSVRAGSSPPGATAVETNFFSLNASEAKP
jgi:hypothetical protein